ncbi:MAG TPA: hypothetical protein VM032_15165 [Vicinamibacterales bacterium]|nr:hypothetical protein [Vicinamibacterales bacterium]
MPSRTHWIVAAGLVLALVDAGRALHAQVLTYNSGQPISAGYEGWEQDADGTKYFVFGYMNKNWEEEMDIPVGPDNGFQPGAADRGQPTHFFPRRNRYVFRVPVPTQFREQDELVWTLTTHGRTSKAYASLRPDLQLDALAKASDTGALPGMASSPELRANKPPAIAIEGARSRSVRVGQRLALVATVVDDGMPKATTEEETRIRAQRATAARAVGASGSGPAGGAASAAGERSALDIWRVPPQQGSVNKNNGLHLSWFHYRGPGPVHFDPPQIKTWEDLRVGANSPWAPVWFAPPMPADGRVMATVTFDLPGTYVLRARADDGPATTDEEVTVTVTP